ncbi:MAG TPA: M20/M25/M40 family metallo-hydrolase [Balneolaceae bacterium]|nr:M20/M25/M40 family metallo-hydrolase [Balneolaceae bacterium]
MRPLYALLVIFFLSISGCNDSEPTVHDGASSGIDTEQLLDDLRFLSSDELQGRKTGSEGNRIAREFLSERFRKLGLKPGNGQEFEQKFSHTNPRTNELFDEAVNLIAIVEGSDHPETYIAITAHYDHLGVRDGEIYNGADDNASGTAALLAISEYFLENQPSNSLLIIAFDAEEQGLAGARHFINNPAVSLDQILMNVNMDMISNNFEDELYAVGTYHYPFLTSYVERAARKSAISVKFGYDSDEWPQNWTMSSDHGPFHSAGIPFLYFGVEDHPHYHSPTDTFENINPEFYIEAVRTIIHVIEELDLHSDELARQIETLRKG